jgi:DNA repair protein RecO
VDSFTARGVILHSREYKEKDRLVSFLTSDRGLITVLAKGSAKLGSRNAYVSVPFMVCDFVITSSHGFYYLKDGSIVENNSSIMGNLEALTVASHFADCLNDASLQSDNSREAYELAVYAFYCLAQDTAHYRLICAAFNWRLLTILGFTVNYGVAPEDRSQYCVSMSDGRITRADGLGKAAASSPVLNGVSLRLLDYFASCPLNRLFVVKTSDRVTDEVFGFSVQYLSLHFDKEYTVLSVLNDIGGVND